MGTGVSNLVDGSNSRDDKSTLRDMPAHLALVVILACILVVMVQIHIGAYTAELGYDESSHYVSGLLIYDYLASALFQSPMQFLRDFASAYPLVGIGHWGPFWYLVEAIWMFLFGESRMAIMAFSAATTVAIAVLLYSFTVKSLGKILAVFLALAFVCSPITQLSSTAVIPDGAVTLICFAGTIVWSRYTQTLNSRYSVAFGVIAALGLLTKGNAGCLALVPPIFLLVDRNWEILRRASFWAPVGIVLAAAGPWYLVTYHQVSQGFRYGWGWPYTSVAVPENFQILAAAYGPVLLGIAPLGLIPLFRSGYCRVKDLSRVGVALLIAVIVFQCVVPAAIQVDIWNQPYLRY